MTTTNPSNKWPTTSGQKASQATLINSVESTHSIKTNKSNLRRSKLMTQLGKLKLFHRKGLYLTASFATMVCFQNCSNVNFSAAGAQANSLSTAAATNNPAPAATPPLPSTSDVLKAYQPALAVRGIACLLCHANIQANVFTDFGHGNSWFLGQTNPFDAYAENQQSWYSNPVNAWQTAQIQGTVFVPTANVTANALTMLSPSPATMSLIDFMQTPYTPTALDEGNDYSQKAMTFGITPTTAGAAPVFALKNLVIRAPSIADLSAIDSAFFAGGVGFKRVGSSAATQLILQNNGNGQFVTNDPTTPLNCQNADILVNGNLYLRGLQVNAGGGCRFYVSGTVFIEDSLTYTDGAADDNLQITSVRAISMGIGIAGLQERLQDPNQVRGLQIAAADFATLANQVVADATMIGTLKDAQTDYGGNIGTFQYSGLLLNAPIIHSRYEGMVQGVVIAEAALFALGQFGFQYDAVFSTTPVLPQLLNPVLIAQ